MHCLQPCSTASCSNASLRQYCWSKSGFLVENLYTIWYKNTTSAAKATLYVSVLIPTVLACFTAAPKGEAPIDSMLCSKMKYLIRRKESGRRIELKGWHHLYRKPSETALDQLATVSADVAQRAIY